MTYLTKVDIRNNVLFDLANAYKTSTGKDLFEPKFLAAWKESDKKFAAAITQDKTANEMYAQKYNNLGNELNQSLIDICNNRFSTNTETKQKIRDTLKESNIKDSNGKYDPNSDEHILYRAPSSDTDIGFDINDAIEKIVSVCDQSATPKFKIELAAASRDRTLDNIQNTKGDRLMDGYLKDMLTNDKAHPERFTLTEASIAKSSLDADTYHSALEKSYQYIEGLQEAFGKGEEAQKLQTQLLTTPEKTEQNPNPISPISAMIMSIRGKNPAGLIQQLNDIIAPKTGESTFSAADISKAKFLKTRLEAISNTLGEIKSANSFDAPIGRELAYNLREHAEYSEKPNAFFRFFGQTARSDKMPNWFYKTERWIEDGLSSAFVDRDLTVKNVGTWIATSEVAGLVTGAIAKKFKLGWLESAAKKLRITKLPSGVIDLYSKIRGTSTTQIAATATGIQTEFQRINSIRTSFPWHKRQILIRKLYPNAEKAVADWKMAKRIDEAEKKILLRQEAYARLGLPTNDHHAQEEAIRIMRGATHPTWGQTAKEFMLGQGGLAGIILAAAGQPIIEYFTGKKGKEPEAPSPTATAAALPAEQKKLVDDTRTKIKADLAKMPAAVRNDPKNTADIKEMEEMVKMDDAAFLAKMQSMQAAAKQQQK